MVIGLLRMDIGIYGLELRRSMLEILSDIYYNHIDLISINLIVSPFGHMQDYKLFLFTVEENLSVKNLQIITRNFKLLKISL